MADGRAACRLPCCAAITRNTPYRCDTEAVDIAIRAGVDVASSTCRNRDGQTCPLLDGCPKQQNLREVAAADVVIAAYDALFTGCPGDTDGVGLIIVDEGCWSRSVEEHPALALDELMRGLAGSLRPRAGFDPDADLADLHAMRSRLQAAFSSCDGAVTRQALLAAKLTEEECLFAAGLEERLVRDPKLRPGMECSLRSG